MLKRLRQIGISCALKKLKHSLFMDADARDICARNGAYEYLQRYAYVCNQSHEERKSEPKHNIIWTCWWQGIENAPQLVKKCIENMHKYANGYEVVVIDSHNLAQYIQLPDYIITKHAEGIIPHAHFSDLIRLVLLEQYGGIWIDSTILLTGSLPDYITNSDLFFFRSASNAGHTLICNPFIAAKPHHPIIESMLQLLFAYWKQESKLVSYSIFHLFFAIAVETNPINKQSWERVPMVAGAQIFYIQHQLGKPYDEKTYKLATQLSTIHKLTYKFNQFDIDITKKGTFYDVLINGSKPC